VTPAGGSNEVREAERLGPITVDGRPSDEERRVGSRATDRGGQDGMPTRCDREQSVRAQERPSGLGGPGKPLLQCSPDLRELGRPARDRDDRQSELSVQRVEVEHVEAPDDGAIEQNRADPFERPQAPDQGDDPPSPVGPVDSHVSGTNGLHVFRQREGNRRDRRGTFVPVERSVVHADHAGVGLSEGAPQG
jgi:hypothetical protein